MTSILALGSVTVDQNIRISDEQMKTIGVAPDSILLVEDSEMFSLRMKLEGLAIPLPEIVSGGSVGNTTNLLARAGEETGFFGVGGSDHFGNKFKGDCKRVGTQFLYPLQSGLVTGHNFCFSSEEGKSTIVWTPGSNRFIAPSLLEDSLFREAVVVLLDGFICANSACGEETIDRAIKLAKRTGTPYVMTLASVDVVSSHREMFLRNIGEASLVAGNLSQAAALLGLPLDAPAFTVLPALARIAPNTLITLGSAGAHVTHGDEQYQTGIRKVPVLDTTGAGDSFLGGYLVARQRGFSAPRALEIATFIAGELVRYHGPRLPDSVDALNLFHQAESWRE